MKLLDYQKAAQRTCKDLGLQSSNIAHMALGFSSELAELEECMNNHPFDKVNLGEELGDKLWYAVNYATFRDIDLSEFNFSNAIPADAAYSIIMVSGGKMADFAKRLLAYGQRIEDQKEYKNEKGILFNYIDAIFNFASDYDLDIEQVMGRNIVKLYIRYPDKFSDDKALTRDLEAEREALEGKTNE